MNNLISSFLEIDFEINISDKKSRRFDLSEVIFKCIKVHYFKTFLQMSYIPFVNPLSPNSDQQQFSPNDIHTLSWDEVMRINKMIT